MWAISEVDTRKLAAKAELDVNLSWRDALTGLTMKCKIALSLPQMPPKNVGQ